MTPERENNRLSRLASIKRDTVIHRSTVALPTIIDGRTEQICAVVVPLSPTRASTYPIAEAE